MFKKYIMLILKHIGDARCITQLGLTETIN